MKKEENSHSTFHFKTIFQFKQGYFGIIYIVVACKRFYERFQHISFRFQKDDNIILIILPSFLDNRENIPRQSMAHFVE